MKKTIAVDMDGVLVDVFGQYVQYHQAEFGQVFTPQDKYGIPELEAFPNINHYLHQTGFFREAKPIENGIDILKKLNQQHQIFIVSAAIEYPKSLQEKLDWIEMHLPFIHWKQIVFCGSKQIVKADTMIDDHFKNLDYFDGETLLFTQPHNALQNTGKHQRVGSWLEIEKMLLTT